MSITAGTTYSVKIPFGFNSPKRFNDAVKLLKGIGDYQGSAASFDSASKTWTITLAADANGALSDLQDACDRYGAEAVAVDSDSAAALRAERAALAARIAEIDQILQCAGSAR